MTQRDGGWAWKRKYRREGERALKTLAKLLKTYNVRLELALPISGARH